ncbi:MAG: peptidase M23 [Acidiferrobacteraceae bacterium]|nr:peptidase M23 [Acidiferrobacteraceae bacterium]
MLSSLMSCSHQSMVPVSDLTSPNQQSSARIVREGDTLYMIAWEVGIDYRLIAKWNGLSSPYFIEEGKRIRLTQPRKMITNQSYSGSGSINDKLNESSDLPEENVISVKKRKSDGFIPSKNKNETGFDWLWPSEGEVINQFSDIKGQNGIDIAFDEGSAVLAAASGKVVYAGAGLRGYGNLLIIQHDEIYLSAYAHNRRLFVEEGTFVERGKLIAEMGDTDAESARLHFEIRRNGEPVNPLNYLPPR